MVRIIKPASPAAHTFPTVLHKKCSCPSLCDEHAPCLHRVQVLPSVRCHSLENAGMIEKPMRKLEEEERGVGLYRYFTIRASNLLVGDHQHYCLILKHGSWDC